MCSSLDIARIRELQFHGYTKLIMRKRGMAKDALENGSESILYKKLGTYFDFIRHIMEQSVWGDESMWNELEFLGSDKLFKRLHMRYRCTEKEVVFGEDRIMDARFQWHTKQPLYPEFGINEEVYNIYANLDKRKNHVYWVVPGSNKSWNSFGIDWKSYEMEGNNYFRLEYSPELNSRALSVVVEPGEILILEQGMARMECIASISGSNRMFADAIIFTPNMI